MSDMVLLIILGSTLAFVFFKTLRTLKAVDKKAHRYDSYYRDSQEYEDEQFMISINLKVNSMLDHYRAMRNVMEHSQLILKIVSTFINEPKSIVLKVFPGQVSKFKIEDYESLVVINFLKMIMSYEQEEYCDL